MKEIGPDGDLVFSSTEFGSGSVSKTDQIATILKDLLGDITLTMRSEDTKLILEKYYMKLEIDEILSNYVKLSQLADEISNQLKILLNSPEFSDKYASQEDLKALNEVVAGYSETIYTILGNQESIQSSWTEFRTDVNSKINMQNTSISQLVTQCESLAASVASLQGILDKLNLVELSDVSAKLAEFTQKINDFSNQIGNLSDLKTNTQVNLVSAINELVDTRGTLSNLSTSSKTDLVSAINELFQSASDGKSLIAAAITGKGVDAAADDTFTQLASKIGEISSGGESGSSTPLSDKIIILDSSENFYPSNYSKTFYTGGSGVLVPIEANMMCSSGDDTAHGDAYYVIDGVENHINNYNDFSKIPFNSSIGIRIGDMLLDSSGTNVCDSCGESPLFLLSAIIVTQ